MSAGFYALLVQGPLPLHNAELSYLVYALALGARSTVRGQGRRVMSGMDRFPPDSLR